MIITPGVLLIYYLLVFNIYLLVFIYLFISISSSLVLVIIQLTLYILNSKYCDVSVINPVFSNDYSCTYIYRLPPPLGQGWIGPQPYWPSLIDIWGFPQSHCCLGNKNIYLLTINWQNWLREYQHQCDKMIYL